ncbi:MAG: NAD kinase [Prevotella sp.]|nr:NAD kinase [Prevotella sp.]
MNNEQKRFRFALFGKEFQEEHAALVRKMFSFLVACDAEVVVEADFFRFLTSKGIEVGPCNSFEGDSFEADFVVSLGGDGTFLKAASRVGSRNIPIMGVNMGRLGFLTDVSLQDVEEALRMLFHGDYEVESRSLIAVESNGEPLTTYPYALNDVAILKCADASMISIRTGINGEHLITCQADGMVVSTPTGSTAYALSNGGPVVVPQTDVFCLTFVAPHSLTVRPMIVPDTAEISLQIDSRSHNYLVAVDGRSVTLQEQTALTLRKAPYSIQIVKRKGYSYFSMLKEKMMWGRDTREKK